MGASRSIKKENGQSLIEILIAMGLMAILLPALLTAMVASREAKPQNNRRMQATMLLREIEEATRSIKENSWDDIATAGTYYPTISGTSWTLASGTETTPEGFTKQMTIEDVYRDTGLAIVETGGTLDPSTKKVTAQVSWTEPIPSSLQSEFYITRHTNNTTWEQSTQTEFDNGTFTDTVSTNNAGGEVELDQFTGGGNWATPILADIYDTTGNTDAMAIFIDGNYAYIGTTTLYIINITDPQNVTLTGSVSVGTTINDIHTSGNYAYLATPSDNAELIVVDISNKATPTQVVSRNLPQKADGLSLEVSGSYLYLGRAIDNKTEEVFIQDISNPTAPTTVGAFETGSNVNDIESAAGFIYLATSNDSKEVVILNTANPTTPVEVGSYNSASTADGMGLYSGPNYLYLTTNNNSTGNEFYVLNITTPSAPALTSSYNVGGNAYEVFVSGTYAFIGSDVSVNKLLILDLSTISSPTQYGFYTVGTKVLDLWVAGNYVYLATDADTQELTVLSGGSGSSGYYLTGTYESQSFDSGADSGFNYFTFTATEPANTDVRLQIAANSDDTTWNFVGPDGTGGTYYESESYIPLNYAEARYFRFKAYFSGDGTDTAILEDATVNYSP